MNNDQIQDKKDEMEVSRFGWYFLYALIIVLLAVDIVKWDADFVYHNNYHCYVIGFLIFLVFTIRTQIIIDNNLFIKYNLIAVAAVCILVIKMLATTFSLPALLGIMFPVLYLAILRLLIRVLFKGYPGDQTPVFIFRSRYSSRWKGQENGYIPTNAEYNLSRWTEICTYTLLICICAGAVYKIYHP